MPKLKSTVYICSAFLLPFLNFLNSALNNRKLTGVKLNGSESRRCHLNFRYGACFEQGVS